MTEYGVFTISDRNLDLAIAYINNQLVEGGTQAVEFLLEGNGFWVLGIVEENQIVGIEGEMLQFISK